MPKLPRGAGPIGLTMSAVDLWRRLPKQQRDAILKQARAQARAHGPRVAKTAASVARAVIKSKP